MTTPGFTTVPRPSQVARAVQSRPKMEADRSASCRPRRDADAAGRGAYQANEGIWVGRIKEAVQKKLNGET